MALFLLLALASWKVGMKQLERVPLRQRVVLALRRPYVAPRRPLRRRTVNDEISLSIYAGCPPLGFSKSKSSCAVLQDVRVRFRRRMIGVAQF